MMIDWLTKNIGLKYHINLGDILANYYLVPTEAIIVLIPLILGMIYGDAKYASWFVIAIVFALFRLFYWCYICNRFDLSYYNYMHNLIEEKNSIQNDVIKILNNEKDN